MYVNANNSIFFRRLRVEDITEEINKVIKNKNITINIYRMQSYHCILCGYFCIGYIDLLIKDKILLDHTNIFSPNEYEKNGKTILKYFQLLKRLR